MVWTHTHGVDANKHNHLPKCGIDIVAPWPMICISCCQVHYKVAHGAHACTQLTREYFAVALEHAAGLGCSGILGQAQPLLRCWCLAVGCARGWHLYFGQGVTRGKV